MKFQGLFFSKSDTRINFYLGYENRNLNMRRRKKWNSTRSRMLMTFFFYILDLGAIDTRWTGMEVCFLSFYVNGMSENCIHNSLHYNIFFENGWISKIIKIWLILHWQLTTLLQMANKLLSNCFRSWCNFFISDTSDSCVYSSTVHQRSERPV